ncbi:MAG: TonB-dependent receptor [bacterium]
MMVISDSATLPDLWAQSQYGRITGKIVEQKTGAALPGANVVLVGTHLGAATDRQGYYLIPRIPAGTYDISVRYIGYEEMSKPQVKVLANQTLTLDFGLMTGAFAMSEVMVTAGRLAQSQATALHAQNEALSIKSVVASDLIGSFPDANASETLTRLPAISVTRDHGEGRFVIIRGIRKEYNSTRINGERIPSAERTVRSVALDVLPAYLLESIEVSKTTTPDMDGDAIGGSVNLIMKDAPDRRIFNVTAGYGLIERQVPQRQHNRQDIMQLNVVTGDAFSGGKFGYLVSGSYNDYFLKTDADKFDINLDPEDAGVDALLDGTEQWCHEEYEINRIRFGINGSFLYKPGVGHKLYFRGLFSRFSDQEFLHRVETEFDDSPKIDRAIKDRFEVQTIQNYTVGAEHTLANGLQLDYHYTFTKNRGDRSKDFRSEYELVFDDATRTLNAQTSRRVQDGGLIGPDNVAGYRFDGAELNATDARDYEHILMLNTLVPLELGSFPGNIKLGLKAKFRDRSFRRHKFNIGELDEDPFYLPGGVDTREFPDVFADFRPPVSLELEDELLKRADTDIRNNFALGEDILAAYGQGEFSLSKNLTVLAGLRIEKTLNATFSTPVNSGNTGDRNLQGGRTQRRSKESYMDVFPSLHVRYKPAKSSNIRFAVSRGISRPSFFDIIPVDYTRKRRRVIGNPELDPVRAINVDLLFEHFDARFAGLISGGLFYKRFENPIETFVVPDPDPDIRSVSQPQNSQGNGTIKGFEVAFQKQLSFIGLKQFGILANYTFSDGTLDFDPRVVESQERKDRPLQGHSKHLVNFALNYENPRIGFSGQIAWKFKSSSLEDLGGTSQEDEFEADYSRFDLTVNQRMFSSVTYFLEGRNLTNEPERFYLNNSVTGKQQDVSIERYGRSFVTGVKLNF